MFYLEECFFFLTFETNDREKKHLLMQRIASVTTDFACFPNCNFILTSIQHIFSKIISLKHNFKIIRYRFFDIYILNLKNFKECFEKNKIGS